MPLKKGLGKGLDAIIGSNKSVKKEKPVKIKEKDDFQGSPLGEIAIENISINPHQARKTFDQAALEELAESISVSGILQPLVATRKKAGNFVLVAGERRLRAAKIAGLKKVPVRVVQMKSGQSLAVLGLVENLQREDLDPLEEAEAFNVLSDKFKLTQQQIAKTVAKSRPYVANAVRLLDLPEKVLDLIRQGKISAGHGRAILRLIEPGERIAMANRIVAKSLSVRDTEKLVEKAVSLDKEKRRSPNKKDNPHKWIADELRGRFGTKVEFQGKTTKGRIVIHYFSEEDLTRIVDILKT